jgi:hypothetical protein
MKYLLVLCMLAFVGCATIECVEENGKTVCDKKSQTEKKSNGHLGEQ